MTAFLFAILNSCSITGRVAILNYCPIRRLLSIHHLAFLTNQRQLHLPPHPHPAGIELSLLHYWNLSAIAGDLIMTSFTAQWGRVSPEATTDTAASFRQASLLKLVWYIKEKGANPVFENPATYDFFFQQIWPSRPLVIISNWMF